MSDSFTLAIWIVVVWFLSMFTVEFSGHIARDYQVKEVKEFAVQQIADNGGYTVEVENKVKVKMAAYGLDESIFKINAPSDRVNFQENFSFQIDGSYTYRAFNLLGSTVGNFTVLISDKGSGIGNVYYR